MINIFLKNQVSIRVDAEEYEREVAPIIVIQTPDPLLRLQVNRQTIIKVGFETISLKHETSQSVFEEIMKMFSNN